MKKERRSLFSMIFGNKAQTPQQVGEYQQLKMLNGYLPVFTPFGEEAYNSDIVRTAIDSIARNAAKLKPKHIRHVNNQIIDVDDNIQYLLQTRPNKYMDAYSFYYKVITQLYMQNNAFVYMDLDNNGSVKGFYPINAINVDLIEYKGEVYARFLFLSGERITLPYTDLIHLRRFYYKHDFYGEPNNTALIPTLNLINATDQGIINAIKSTAGLRGLLKFTQSMLKEEDLKKQRDNFVTDYLDISNNGGVAALDSKADYTELKGDPKIADDKQMALIENKIYDYYGVSKPIITSNYNEDQWSSFYASVIEPLAVQMSLEFTSKIFTDREQGFGNEIIFEANRLQYASTKSKTMLAKELMPMGIFTVNEIREIFNLEPVEGGDRRIQTLNVVNADKADEYQGVGNNEGGEEENGEGEGTATGESEGDQNSNI